MLQLIIVFKISYLHRSNQWYYLNCYRLIFRIILALHHISNFSLILQLIIILTNIIPLYPKGIDIYGFIPNALSYNIIASSYFYILINS